MAWKSSADIARRSANRWWHRQRRKGRNAPSPLYWFNTKRRDPRASLTWHHVAVQHLHDAAVARREGDYIEAQYLLREARAAVRNSAGWSLVTKRQKLLLRHRRSTTIPTL